MGGIDGVQRGTNADPAQPTCPGADTARGQASGQARPEQTRRDPIEQARTDTSGAGIA